MKKVIILFLFLLLVSTLQAYDNALEVKTDVEGVKIYLEGKYQGETEHFDKNVNIWRKDDLEPGSYTLKCTNKNFDPNIQTVTIRAEGPTVVKIKFRQREIQTEQLTDYDKGEQVKQTGTIIIRSKPTGANVYLNDSKQSATCDVKLKEVTIGNKQVKIKFGSKSPLKTSFNLSAGDTVKVIADFFNNTIKTDVKYKFTINSKPKGKLYVEDKYIGLCPQTLEVNKGKLSYKIVKKGFKTYYGTEHVTMNDFVTIELSGLGTIKINVNKKDAKVYVDGKYVGKGNVELEGIREGNHFVEIEKYGFEKEDFSIPVEINQTTYIEANIIKKLTLQKPRYTLNDLGYEKKNWQDYYDATLKKPEIKWKFRPAEYIGRILFCQPMVIGLFPITLLAQGELGWDTAKDGSFIRGTKGHLEKKYYPCSFLMFFDKDLSTYKVGVIEENVAFNKKLKDKAQKNADEFNRNKLDLKNEEIIKINDKINSNNSKLLLLRSIRYKIGDGKYKEILKQ